MIIAPALFLDILLGDPPNRFHPTAWMGNLISMFTFHRPREKPALELIHGGAIVVFGAGLSALVGNALEYLFDQFPAPFNWLGIALILKSTISFRGLYRAAAEVQSALEKGDLVEARRLLSWHLVSRDTSQLDKSKVTAAAIESVAENASDGIIAPLFFFAVGGLPAALAYRFINTADSMLGYRDPAREWLGKIPARFDDILNVIPARLAGLFIVLSAPFCGGKVQQAWQIMWRDAGQTASPNAGVPMSAMAGALGVELEKVGHYRLGHGLRLPEVADLACARRTLICSMGWGIIVTSLIEVL